MYDPALADLPEGAPSPLGIAGADIPELLDKIGAEPSAESGEVEGATAAARSPQRAVGRTIAEVRKYSFRSEVWFTDGTKLQVEPGEMDADGDEQAPALIFQDDPAAD